LKKAKALNKGKIMKDKKIISESYPLIVTLRTIYNERGDFRDDIEAVFHNLKDFLEAVNSSAEFNNAQIKDVSIQYTENSDENIFGIKIEKFIMSRDGEKFNFSLDKALKHILSMNLFKIQIHIIFKNRFIFRDIIGEAGGVPADSVSAGMAIRARLKVI